MYRKTYLTFDFVKNCMFCLFDHPEHQLQTINKLVKFGCVYGIDGDKDFTIRRESDGFYVEQIGEEK